MKTKNDYDAPQVKFCALIHCGGALASSFSQQQLEEDDTYEDVFGNLMNE